MNHDTLIDDVLSYLPNWAVVPEDENHDKLLDYEHSYSERFLIPDDAHKDQLDVAKYVTPKEVIQEFKRSTNYIENYTHRERLPHEPDIYDSLCKYTAGSLYLKYNLDSKSKVHGYALRKEAISQIEPYVIIKAKPMPHHPRCVRYPKWFKDVYPPQVHFYDEPHRHCESGHIPPRQMHKTIRHKKPFVLVNTFQKMYNMYVHTYERKPFKITVVTHKARKRSRCMPWFARRDHSR